MRTIVMMGTAFAATAIAACGAGSEDASGGSAEEVSSEMRAAKAKDASCPAADVYDVILVEDGTNVPACADVVGHGGRWRAVNVPDDDAMRCTPYDANEASAACRYVWNATRKRHHAAAPDVDALLAVPGAFATPHATAGATSSCAVPATSFPLLASFARVKCRPKIMRIGSPNTCDVCVPADYAHLLAPGVWNAELVISQPASAVGLPLSNGGVHVVPIAAPSAAPGTPSRIALPPLGPGLHYVEGPVYGLP